MYTYRTEPYCDTGTNIQVCALWWENSTEHNDFFRVANITPKVLVVPVKYISVPVLHL